MTIRAKCEMNEKGEILLCENLKNTLDPQKGMDVVSLACMETGKPRGSAVNLRMGLFRKGGVNLNFCPACGENISQERRAGILDKAAQWL